MMRTLPLLVVLLAAAPAVAKPWQGIEPGASKRSQVLEKFGEPSRTVTSDGKEIIAYFDKAAIKGTKQVQFRVDPASQLVERIDVFPAVVVDREAMENTYGPACPSSGKQPSTPCHLKKVTEDFRTYLLYPRLGLAIFLQEDGKTVHSLVFTTQQSAR
jgi:hypothetical protein